MAFTAKELREELECYPDDEIVWIEMDGMQAPVRIMKDDDDDGEMKLVLK